MTVEKKTIRSDIPGHHSYLNGNVPYGSSQNEESRRMIVGRDISLCGDITSCDHLIVEGIVQASTFTARRLDILEPGLFTGSCEVQDAVIAGRFEGKITVFGRLTVRSTGRIYGNVTYSVLEVESGAKIEGQMGSLAAADAAGMDDAQSFEINDNMETITLQLEESVEETQPRMFRRAAGV